MQAKQTKTTTVLPQQNDETIPVSVPFSPLSEHQGNSPFAPRSPLDPIPTVSKEKYSPDSSPLETPTLRQQSSYKTLGTAEVTEYHLSLRKLHSTCLCNPQENHTQLCSPCIKTNLRPLAPTKHHFSP